MMGFVKKNLTKAHHTVAERICQYAREAAPAPGTKIVDGSELPRKHDVPQPAYPVHYRQELPAELAGEYPAHSDQRLAFAQPNGHHDPPSSLRHGY
jgi:hypothetical protein